MRSTAPRMCRRAGRASHAARLRNRSCTENLPMPSPFPGMDPYLEHAKLWPTFQHQLLACLYQILLPGLVDRYRARVGSRCYVSEMPLFTSIIRDEYTEEFIEIRSRTDNRLVTLVE